MTPHSRPDAGFTLVEVLLAVLIAGLVMVGSYSVASQVMRLSEEANTRLDLENALTITRLALANDLGSVIYVEKNGRVVSSEMVFLGGQGGASLSGDKDVILISLATAATLDPGAPFPSQGFNRIEYVLRRPETNKEAPTGAMRLVRRELPAATVARRDTTTELFNETILLETVEAVSIQFYTGPDVSAETTWDSRKLEGTKQSPLPAQVRLSGTVIVSSRRFPLDIHINLPARTLATGSRS